MQPHRANVSQRGEHLLCKLLLWVRLTFRRPVIGRDPGMDAVLALPNEFRREPLDAHPGAHFDHRLYVCSTEPPSRSGGVRGAYKGDLLTPAHIEGCQLCVNLIDIGVIRIAVPG